MPKPTKQDMALATFLGGRLSATQLRRLTTSEGLGLPPTAAWADYGPVLASLVGKGRDLDVAAIRLAAEHGWYTERLRKVLAQPMSETRAREMWAVVSALMERAAQPVAEAEIRDDPAEVYRSKGETAEQVAPVIAGAARLEVEDVLNGEPVEAFEYGARVSEQIAIMLGGPPEEGGRWVHADEMAEWMRVFAESYTNGNARLAQAAAEALVASVRVAAAMWTATVAAKAPFGEEDTWRMIAILVPLAGVLVALMEAVKAQLAAGLPLGRLPPSSAAGLVAGSRP